MQTWGDIDDGYPADMVADETSITFPADSVNLPGNEEPTLRQFYRIRILPN